MTPKDIVTGTLGGMTPVYVMLQNRVLWFRRSRLTMKLAHGFLWLTLGSVPSRALTLLTTILVARVLGAAVYGEFSLVRSSVNAFVTVATFGMGRTAAKYVAELLATDRVRAGRIVALNYLFTFIMSATVALVFVILAPIICTRMIDAPHLVAQVRLGAPLLVFTALVGAQVGVLAGFQAFRETSIALTISALASAPFFYFGSKFYGLTGAVIGFSIGTIVNFCCNSYAISRLTRRFGVQYSFWNCWREAAVLWNFCLPSTLISLSMSGATWCATILIMRGQNGATELGLFDATRQIQTAALYLPVMASQVITPALSELNALKDRTRFIKTALYNLGVNFLFTLAIALGVILFSQKIMLSFGDDFGQGVAVLTVAALTCVTMSLTNVCSSVLTSLGAMWTRFVTTALWCMTLGYAALHAYLHNAGALGTSYAFLAAYLVMLSTQVLAIVRLLHRGQKEV